MYREVVLASIRYCHVWIQGSIAIEVADQIVLSERLQTHRHKLLLATNSASKLCLRHVAAICDGHAARLKTSCRAGIGES